MFENKIKIQKIDVYSLVLILFIFGIDRISKIYIIQTIQLKGSDIFQYDFLNLTLPLTKEKIDELDEGGLLSLATEFNIATEKMLLASTQQDGSILDLTDDKYNNAFAMIKHIPGAISLKQQIKNVELLSDFDSILINYNHDRM